ncbi:GNAT family N-acetyltransferase [Streptomyces mangrovisoli]|uniref:GNAT family N-acetyltransferase n=1 Tax=Streptomyces mangrovisoli TaxID=1428628 RepID=A0A1J4P575_9ACTN|nr:acetyltransferase [Streptomyces mangrovisoli]OIJ69895.1 GNAT family N-acetyltransferase [Streptomyces mangrovisoli]
MPSADWHLTADLDDFLSRAGDFLASRPAPHTVPLTVTDTLRRHGLHAYSAQAPLFAVLEGGGKVRGAALHTSPHPVHLTAVAEEEAEALATRLAEAGYPVTGVNGESATAAAFARVWSALTGAEGELLRRQRLYRLVELTVPRPVPPGGARVAGPADRDLVARWYQEFQAAIGYGPEHRSPRDARRWADQRIAYGGVTFWETPGDGPVSLAGRTRVVAGQVRVAPVYTPAEWRGRGYAGAVTAEVSRGDGNEVLLFTDLANPTSNALYVRVGYRPVADFAVYAFG